MDQKEFLSTLTDISPMEITRHELALYNDFFGGSGWDDARRAKAIPWQIRKAVGVDLPKIISEEEAEKMSLADKIKHEAEEVSFYRKTIPLTSLLAGGLGAGVGAAIPKKNRVLGSLIGSYLGTNFGGIGETVPEEVQLMRTDPEHSGILTGAIAKTDIGKKIIEKHPELIVSASNVATGGALAALPYYVAKKYYPYHSAKLESLMKPWLERLKSTPKIGKGYLKYLPATLGLIPALSYASYLANEGVLRGTAMGIEKGLEKVKKLKEPSDD